MKSIKFFAVVIVFAVAVPMFGQSASTGLTVEATVAAVCEITTVAVNFGSYNPLAVGDDDDGVGSIDIRCTTGTTGVSVDIDNMGTRVMTDGTDNLSYELYTDALRTTVFNSVNVGAVDIAGASVPVFGRITAGQDVQVGSYAQVVQATVNY